MQISIEGKPLWKWLLIYVCTVGLGYILFPMVWVGVSVFTVVPNIQKDPIFNQEIRRILTTEELQQFNIMQLDKLPEEKRIAIKTLLGKSYRKINWLLTHLFANTITFALLGSLLGLFLLGRYAAMVPVGLWYITKNSLISEEFVVHAKWMTVFLGLTTQLVAVYLFSFLVLRVRKRKGVLARLV